MGIVVRPVTYTGTLQRLVVTQLLAGPCSVQLWGGGGGGGGTNLGTGGFGSGSGYATKTLVLNGGDIIDVAIGEGGGGGLTQSSFGAGGGSAGASYIANNLLLDTRTSVGTWGGVAAPVTYPSWYPWFNSHAVSIPTLPWTYSVNFPASKDYVWQIGADYAMTVKLDGVDIQSISDYTGSWNEPSPYEFTQYVTAGVHTVEIVPVDDGGTAGYAVVIQDYGSAFSGGVGGAPGPIGLSGAGGGGGGATVLFVNGSPIAVAAGGGGGAGGGVSAGQNAPGSAGRATAGTNNGQNGQSNYQDGGGGGAGGGGYGGGNGGLPVYYDEGGTAGSAGGNFGDTVAEPVAQLPGVLGNYGAVGRGGAVSAKGTNGLAAFTFDVKGTWVKDAGSWQPVQQTYVKHNGVWAPVQQTFVKRNGQWAEVTGSADTAPTFSIEPGNFGVRTRSNLP